MSSNISAAIGKLEDNEAILIDLDRILAEGTGAAPAVSAPKAGSAVAVKETSAADAGLMKFKQIKMTEYDIDIIGKAKEAGQNVFHFKSSKSISCI